MNSPATAEWSGKLSDAYQNNDLNTAEKVHAWHHKASQAYEALAGSKLPKDTLVAVAESFIGHSLRRDERTGKGAKAAIKGKIDNRRRQELEDISRTGRSAA